MKLRDASIDLEVTPQEAVVAVLSAQIMRCLRAASSEQFFPSGDADKMDNTIVGNLKQAAQLRKLRDEYENIISEVILTHA